MKRSRFTDEQIAYALRQVDGGTAVADVCRQMGDQRGDLLRSGSCGSCAKRT
jgi:hypothetical protein